MYKLWMFRYYKVLVEQIVEFAQNFDFLLKINESTEIWNRILFLFCHLKVK